jgi:hypothetical protein
MDLDSIVSLAAFFADVTGARDLELSPRRRAIFVADGLTFFLTDAISAPFVAPLWRRGAYQRRNFRRSENSISHPGEAGKEELLMVG